MDLNDAERWVEHYRALEKPLYNVVYRWLWDRAASQDIVQESFLRCWRRRDRVRMDTLKPLLFRTAINLAANLRRRRRLWQLVSWDTLPDERAHDGADTHVVSEAVRRAIDALPEDLRRVITLSELAGLSYREIAAITGIKEGTVGSRRSRALALLRRELGIEEER